ncbi:MAG: trypsin-like peptidase domain-containing protein [Candidatus Doudnabacteria bacterium]
MTKKAIVFVVLCSFFIGGLGGWLLNRYVLPKINSIPLLVKYNLAPQTSPLIINRTEEIRVNEGSDSIAAIQKVKPWLVGVVGGSDLNHPVVTFGGIVLTSDGLIALSKNALASNRNSAINISFSDGVVSPAVIKASDPASDLVFVKVDRNNLATASLGYPKDMQLGQRIIVLSPTINEFQPTDRVSFLSAEVKNPGDKVYSADMINQTFKVDDLTAVPDGSMVLSLDANVQGIYSNSSIITADTIRSALNSYFANGKISRIQLGFSYGIFPKAAALINQTQQGVLVRKLEGKAAVVAGSSAAKAGLQEGDLITSVNNVKLDLDNTLEEQLGKLKNGDVAIFGIKRNKQDQTLSLSAVFK